MADVRFTSEVRHFVASAADAGKRLDTFLTEVMPERSRVQVRRMIVAGGVKVEGLGRKVAYKLDGHENIVVQVPEMPKAGATPEEIPLEILFEDEHLLAVNKPPGMVVHPARGHWSGTLASALAFHIQQLSTVGGPTRPGIVHRLDRDTSGVLVVAKSDTVHLALASQFEQRTTEKEYVALVMGNPDRDRDWIDEPIGIHPYQREKMSIRRNHPDSREAVTFYEVIARYRHCAYVKVLPKTGRTHQIRVHLAHIGHPVMCDRLYGGRAQVSRGELVLGKEDGQILLRRQALHARRLSLTHPVTQATLTFQAPLPSDFRTTLEALASV